MQLPNTLGVLFGIIQMALYLIYRSSTSNGKNSILPYQQASSSSSSSSSSPSFLNCFRAGSSVVFPIHSNVYLVRARGPNQNLSSLSSLKWNEYESLLQLEEIVWFQKSRAKWIEFGDRNTKYFHRITTIRRRKNHIKILQNDRGDWVTNAGALEEMAGEFFQRLFTPDCSLTNVCLAGHFPKVDSMLLSEIARPVTSEEICKTVRSIGAFKAPGSDGF